MFMRNYFKHAFTRNLFRTTQIKFIDLNLRNIAQRRKRSSAGKSNFSRLMLEIVDKHEREERNHTA